MTGGVSVSGGLGAIRAPGAALEQAAAALHAEAGRLADVLSACASGYWGLWTVASLGPDPDRALLQAAQEALDAVRAALTHASDELETTARGLAAAAQLYELTDRLGEGAFGAIAGLWHVMWPGFGDAAGGAFALPGAVAGAVRSTVTDGPAAGANALVTGDPQLADTIVGASAVLAASTPWWRTTVAGLEAFLHAHFADGTAVVTDAGQDTSVIATRPPRDLADLVGGLAWRDANEDETTRSAGGEIDVKLLHHADGTRSVVVDIPGTKDWGLSAHDPDVTNPGSNLRAVAGESTSYERGVLAALRLAGVRPDEPVLLVGHSLGGMVAVTAARDAVRSGRFDVTDVVTAGSPIGRSVRTLPASVRVLALENAHDVVPELDGRANPATPNVVTVTGSVRGQGIGADHGLGTAYEPIAEQAQSAGDPAVDYELAAQQRYLDADRVEVRRFVITRATR